ncbi:MAG: TetR family transcriptional regulator, partial [Myxococcota bacterium]
MTAARRRRFDPEANRAAILAAAEACFLAGGYAGTSMSEIAKASARFDDRPFAELAALERHREQ